MTLTQSISNMKNQIKAFEQQILKISNKAQQNQTLSLLLKALNRTINILNNQKNKISRQMKTNVNASEKNEQKNISQLSQKNDMLYNQHLQLLSSYTCQMETIQYQNQAILNQQLQSHQSSTPFLTLLHNVICSLSKYQSVNQYVEISSNIQNQIQISNIKQTGKYGQDQYSKRIDLTTKKYILKMANIISQNQQDKGQQIVNFQQDQFDYFTQHSILT